MKTKLTEQYKNRYGDMFTFSYDPEKNTVLWQGDFEYCRYGWEDESSVSDNHYTMVDPSGGPYISSGIEAKFIISKLEGEYVDYMSLNKDEKGKVHSINIYLKPLKK